MRWQTAIARSWSNPRGALSIVGMLARGWYYRLHYRLRGQRVRIGRNFRVAGRWDIRGPGTVVFGDDCTVIATAFAPVTPYTHSQQAIIQIGHRVVLNGTRLGCCQCIDIAEDCVFADARLFDTDFHALESAGRHRWHTIGVTKPITIGPDVWVGVGRNDLERRFYRRTCRGRCRFGRHAGSAALGRGSRESCSCGQAVESSTSRPGTTRMNHRGRPIKLAQDVYAFCPGWIRGASMAAGAFAECHGRLCLLAVWCVQFLGARSDIPPLPPVHPS
jgi:acetyltransferase-like isoleucine patch superfamily enzyme